MEGMKDWNEMNIDEYIKHLEQKFMFDSSGTAKAVFELISTYKALTIQRVSQQRELLIAYEKNHYTPQEWALASKQCIEDIDNFLAINCG